MTTTFGRSINMRIITLYLVLSLFQLHFEHPKRAFISGLEVNGVRLVAQSGSDVV